MGQTIRFGVSLNSELLEKFDALCDEKSYQTRSEAIRDLIRGVLVQKEWEQSDKEVAGVLTLVYDHHTSDLAQRLIETQHEQHDGKRRPHQMRRPAQQMPRSSLFGDWPSAGGS